jgi:hypothetical protein
LAAKDILLRYRNEGLSDDVVDDFGLTLKIYRKQLEKIQSLPWFEQYVLDKARFIDLAEIDERENIDAEGDHVLVPGRLYMSECIGSYDNSGSLPTDQRPFVVRSCGELDAFWNQGILGEFFNLDEALEMNATPLLSTCVCSGCSRETKKA